jgi:hypothetical protein
MRRIMYIENKDGGLDGPGRIGWVEYWTKIRRQPSRVKTTEYRAGASTRTAGSTRRSERGARGGRPGR